MAHGSSRFSLSPYPRLLPREAATPASITAVRYSALSALDRHKLPVLPVWLCRQTLLLSSCCGGVLCSGLTRQKVICAPKQGSSHLPTSLPFRPGDLTCEHSSHHPSLLAWPTTSSSCLYIPSLCVMQMLGLKNSAALSSLVFPWMTTEELDPNGEPPTQHTEHPTCSSTLCTTAGH